MPEDKHTEWKESWRDEYLKHICGFANAQGGTLQIGKNDQGKVVGVTKAQKLLEDLPNKIMFWNTCHLPAGRTVKNITKQHQSKKGRPKQEGWLLESDKA